jgi:hypothetical protein
MTTATQLASPARQAPHMPRPASRTAKHATQPAAAPHVPNRREGTITAMVVEMLRQEGGASVAELTAVTGWRKATVRGFVSTLISKHALPIIRARRQDLLD